MTMPFNLPYQWRITRYDPALRNRKGNYPLGDWSFFAQVGKVFNSEELTYQRYLAWETVYASAAVAFLADAGLDSLQIEYLENRNIKNIDAEQYKDITVPPSSLRTEMLVPKDHLADVVRLNLREVVWSKLTAETIAGVRFYLHFGWDFYMYIGSSMPCIRAIQSAESSGLFVELNASPYLNAPEDDWLDN